MKPTMITCDVCQEADYVYLNNQTTCDSCKSNEVKAVIQKAKKLNREAEARKHPEVVQG